MDRSWRPKKSPSTRGKVKLPSASLPRMPGTPRNPAGYGVTEISLRAAGLPGAASLKTMEPAGDPPDWWEGTRPEWAVAWALEKLGYEEGYDWMYRFNVAGIGASYFSQFDFVIFDMFIAIEVQGEFWHYAQGSEKIANDSIRRTLAASHNYILVFIDEDDVLLRPEYLVEEALRGIDHSKASIGK